MPDNVMFLGPNMPHPATLAAEELLSQCRVERLRRSGPGGQHRNKVETGIRIAHRPTGVTAEATELRSQAKNQATAIARLRVNLALKVRAAARPESPPSPLWQSRVRAGKIRVSIDHEDYPAMLAEVLDRLAAQTYDVRQVATILGCTTTQLVRFLQREPRAILQVNTKREKLGLHALR